MSPALPLTSVAAGWNVPPSARLPVAELSAWKSCVWPWRARLIGGGKYVFGNTEFMTGKIAGMGFAGGLPVAYPKMGWWFDQRLKGSGEAARRLPAVCISLA